MVEVNFLIQFSGLARTLRSTLRLVGYFFSTTGQEPSAQASSQLYVHKLEAPRLQDRARGRPHVGIEVFRRNLSAHFWVSDSGAIKGVATTM